MSYQLPTHWFEMDTRVSGLLLPETGLRSSANGFSFHAWLWLDKLSRNEMSVSYHRRQLFRFITEDGNGFEVRRTRLTGHAIGPLLIGKKCVFQIQVRR